MARHLIGAGHDLRVFTRTRARADELLAAGAVWCEGPAQAALDAQIAITMLGYPQDVRELVLGEGGVLAAMAPGSIYVDHTTSEPGLAQQIAANARLRGIGALDAPVSGGDVGARRGALVIMVGGDQQDFTRARPVLDVYASKLVLVGGAGAGQHAKMVNQIAIAAGMVALCESLLYAYRSGLDVEQVLETISEGAAGSWSMANYAPRLLRGDLEPGFRIEHFVKDLGIALAEARRMGLALPGTALAEQLYVAASAQDLGHLGTHALFVALAQLSGIEAPSGACADAEQHGAA